MQIDIWDHLWLLWLVLFGVLETAALLRKGSGDTLTENVREWFATRKGFEKAPYAKGRRFLLLTFLAWACVHFLKDGFV